MLAGILRDLTMAIVVGFTLGSVLFIHRMSPTTEVATNTTFIGRDEADTTYPRESCDTEEAADPDVVIYRIGGALFFGATASIGSVLDRIQDTHKTLIVDFTAVPFLDSTGANLIEALTHKAHKRGVALWLTGARRDVRRAVIMHGLRRPLVRYAAIIEDAVASLRDGAKERREAA